MSSRSLRNKRALTAAAFALVIASGADRSAHADEVAGADEVANADAYPRIELVTMGIGSLIWERHGHIALCVTYSDPRRDRCYNYGVANFADPVGMGTAFFRGKKSFWVDAQLPERMISIYTNADRTVWSQRLPLTPSQKTAVIEKLRFDVKKENRYYSYDHFFDNCTTRVRDVLDDAMGGALRAIDPPMGEATIRDYARQGFYEMRWALVITDLFMGRVTDKVPSYWERMYLPQYMREAFETEFGVKPVVLYQRQGPPHPNESYTGRFLLFLLILLLTAPAWLTRWWGRFERIGLALSLLPSILIGVVVWAGVLASPVGYLRWTEAFFVFVPLDAVLPFLGARRARRYAQLRVAMLLVVSLLLAIGVFVQPLLVPLLWPLIPCATVALLGPRTFAFQGTRSPDEEE